jgi:hypothetical protein
LKPFFADTYALLAWYNGDPGFVGRFAGTTFRTGFLNLMECHFVNLKKGILAAESAAILRLAEPYAIAADWATLREAAATRHRLRSQGRNSSYVDAVGYVMAQREGLPFLTGDKAFKKLAGVEFLRASPA